MAIMGMRTAPLTSRSCSGRQYEALYTHLQLMSPCLDGDECNMHQGMSNEKSMNWQMLAKISPLRLEGNSEAPDSIFQAEQSSKCWFNLWLLSQQSTKGGVCLNCQICWWDDEATRSDLHLLGFHGGWDVYPGSSLPSTSCLQLA